MAATDKYFYATGSRKTSKARVFLKPGKGTITINGKKADEFLPTVSARAAILQPLTLTDTRNHYDARITVIGGGVTGQSEAIRHGIARALIVANAELRGTLKKAGLLKRDARMVERKKYGKHGARRSTQFSNVNSPSLFGSSGSRLGRRPISGGLSYDSLFYFWISDGLRAQHRIL